MQSASADKVSNLEAESKSGAFSSGTDLPKSYLLVHNVSKKHNIGTLSRSCTAFGVTQVCIVGQNAYNTFGSHGAAEHVDIRHFWKLEDAAKYLKEDCHCDIVGVEIVEGALAVHKRPFKGNTAFILGNEGTGLSPKQIEICDYFVYVSQYGPGTASLNVTVAASIVLHEFAVWAGMPERGREGQKFVVAERPVRQSTRRVCQDSPEDVAAARKERQAASLQDHNDDLGLGSIDIEDYADIE
eukprot:TRINITY_DN14883_c0_g1_i1.p1 TRINITY_DN14883_c0_g1~~TRINITY_DN14883_c0_g1_i1.p1  ORF type:complete len:242 (-),score=29.96 TRINITY_DN14883_c0_g1_i1:148-873(-)